MNGKIGFLNSIPNIKIWFKKWFEEAKLDYLTESILPIFLDDKGIIFKENSVIFEKKDHPYHYIVDMIGSPSFL